MESTASIFIIIITFVILGGILTVTIRKNWQVYSHFKEKLDEVTKKQSDSLFIQHLSQEYKETLAHSENRLNVQTFVETFLSKYEGKRINEINLIKTGGSTAILIGVLGTFIGLIIALAEINTEALDESITNVLSGVNTAFYTSVAGIICSIILNFVVKKWNSEQMMTSLVLTLENHLMMIDKTTSDYKIVHALVDMKGALQEMSLSFIDMSKSSLGFKEATKNLNDFNEVFTENTKILNTTFKDMETFTHSFNEKMNRLDEGISNLIHSHEQQIESINQVAGTVTDVSNHLDERFENEKEERIIQNQYLNQLHESAENQSKKVDETMSLYTESMKDSNENMKEFYTNTLDKQETLVAIQGRIEEKNKAFITNMNEGLSIIREVLEHDSFDSLKEATDMFTKTLSGMDQQFEQLLHYFKKADQEKEDYQVFINRVIEYMDSQEKEQLAMINAFQNRMDQISNQNEQVQTQLVSMFDSYNEKDEEQRKVIDEMKDFAKNVTVKMDEFTSLAKDQGNQLQETIQLHTKAFTNEIANLSSRIDSQVDSLKPYLDNVEQNQQNFNEFYKNAVDSLEKQQEKQSQHEEKFEQSYQQIVTGQKEMLEHLNSMVDSYKDFDEKHSIINDQVVTLSKQLNDTLQKNYDQFEEQSKQLTSSLETFTNVSSTNLTNLIESLNKNLGTNIENLGSNIEKQLNRLGNEIERNLKSFDNYVENTNDIIQKQFKLMVENSKVHFSANKLALDKMREELSKREGINN